MPAAMAIGGLRLGRFTLLVLLVFALQVSMIYWLSDRRPRHPKNLTREAGLVLVNEDPYNLLPLLDQSMFGLPHSESFSGTAWMQSPRLQYKAFDWSEPPRWLPIQFQPVPAIFAELRAEFSGQSGPALGRPVPEFAVPGTLNVQFLPDKSIVRLLSGPEEFRSAESQTLPSLPATELISNSIVQVVAKADGHILSAVLLSGSGNAAADEHALNLARGMRVSPAATGAGLRWAQLSFEWHTVPFANIQPQLKP